MIVAHWVGLVGLVGLVSLVDFLRSKYRRLTASGDRTCSGTSVRSRAVFILVSAWRRAREETEGRRRDAPCDCCGGGGCGCGSGEGVYLELELEVNSGWWVAAEKEGVYCE